MCGIAGIYATKNAWRDDAPFYRMQSVLGHRGPDDRGVDLVPELGIGLVHTRLSVIDLSAAAHQPMWNDDRTIGLVFNGEIYNFPELRQQLKSSGAIFRSRSDTEVILKGYEAWGIEVVNRLNGMFAFGLWDEKRSRLWLVRDRLGKKPLYYWHDASKGIVLFASEIKALLEWPDTPRRVDSSALQCYLALGYVPAPLTMFDGIKKLPAAHLLRYDGKGLSLRRYWDVPNLGGWRASDEEYRRSIRAALEQAVERRLISDVPLGVFLSGGVDSSVVTGLMSRTLKDPVRSFSTAFDVGPTSPKYNVDADTAEVVSRSYNTRHTRFVIRAADDLSEDLRRIVWHMDEPHANPTLLSTFLLSRLVKEHGITVALSGDGSDEIFAGYFRYQADRYVTLMRRLPGVLRRGMTAVARRSHTTRPYARSLMKADIEPMSPERYMTWWNMFAPEERAALLAPAWRENNDAPERCVNAILQRLATQNDQEFQSYADLTLWISEESNMRIDKMSMAHGLEVRSPFLDYHLVETAMAIPFARKAGWRTSKPLLKRTVADLLPDIVLKRPKWGWLTPAHYWLCDSLLGDAKRLVHSLPATGIFSPAVREWVDNYHWSKAKKVWTLMIFALWYHQFIERD